LKRKACFVTRILPKGPILRRAVVDVTPFCIDELSLKVLECLENHVVWGLAVQDGERKKKLIAWASKEDPGN
jgi:hypothetical protein